MCCVCRRRCVLSQEGVLLQRSGAHIGPFTSPGFFTIFNSRGVSLRGLATFDALNGGQGMCTAQLSLSFRLLPRKPPGV